MVDCGQEGLKEVPDLCNKELTNDWSNDVPFIFSTSFASPFLLEEGELGHVYNFGY